MPKISVVVPTHNHARYLSDTIKSVLDQTFTDFELIIVDNGSTDNTKEVVSKFNDPRITYFYQEDSGLPANSRNVGIKMSSADWVAFLDSDDIWLPQKLEKQIKFLETQGEALFCCTNASFFIEEITNTADGNNIESDSHNNTTITVLGLTGEPSDNTYFFDDIFRGNKVICSSVLLKKILLESYGYFNEEPKLRTVEDYDLWLKLALNTPIYYLGEPLVRYRYHPQNLSSNPIFAYEKELEIVQNWENLASSDARRDHLSRIYFGLGRAYLAVEDPLYKSYFKKAAVINFRSPKMLGVFILSKLPRRIFKTIIKRFYRLHRREKFISY